MKINQFAVVATPFEKQLQELATIGFYDETIQNAYSHGARAIWQALLQITFPEVPDGSIKFTDLIADEHQTLAAFFNSGGPVTEQIFNVVALQLLGFVPEQDYEVNQATVVSRHLGLPLYRKAGRWDADDVLTAWYHLLTSHTKYGLQFIDDLASRGYFLKNNVPLFFNGKAMATFDTTNLIKEVVYVETDVDTDADGQCDLIRIEIMRPDTRRKLPVLFTASPYYQGLNEQANDAKIHDVNVPLIRKEPHRGTEAEVTFVAPETALLATMPIKGVTEQTVETFKPHSTVDLNNYFLARGFAVVYAAGVGTRHSDGMQDTGSPAQVASMAAVIEWLAGNRTAFVDRHSGQTIAATWSTGRVAMTGKSYLGTLATAVASTGVRGLETVIAEAAISNWYQYYRDNGLVIAPGGFPGEDMDVLAELVYSRMQDAGDWLQTKAQWQNYQQQTAQLMDRVTGNYNQYWDARNYLKQVKNIKVDMILVHGLNDWNVKPRHVYQLWQALQQQNPTIAAKLYLHQGQHVYINNNRSLDFADQMNLWLSHKLYGVDNQAATQLAPVTWQDNTQAETWHTLTNWGNTAPESLPLMPNPHEMHFEDWQIDEDFVKYTKDFRRWRNLMLTIDDDQLDVNRAVYLQEPKNEPMVIDGEVTLHLRIKSSSNVGMVSAMLVDYGLASRLGAVPTNQGGMIDRGTDWAPTPLMELQLTTPTPFKMISIGHMNLQNRTAPWQVDDLVVDEYVEIDLVLQPTYYRLLAEHQLGVVVYSTDFEMTIRGNQDISYTIDSAHSYVQIPWHTGKNDRR